MVTATCPSGWAPPLLGGRDLSGHAELAVVILLGHHSEGGTKWTGSYNGGRQSLQRPAKEKKNVPEPLHKEVEASSSRIPIERSPRCTWVTAGDRALRRALNTG